MPTAQEKLATKRPVKTLTVSADKEKDPTWGKDAMPKAEGSTKSDWSAIIRSVQTPLGFFALVVLVVEVICGILASIDKGQRAYLVTVMLAVILLLVGIVTCLAIFRPEIVGANRLPASGPTIDQALNVAQNSSIQDLGNFPAFLPTIIEVVKNATTGSTIQIACDYVGYGMFNASKMSDDYRTALIEASRRGCTVQLLVLGSRPWEQMRKQVPDEDEQRFEILRQKEEFRENLDAFSDRVKELKLPHLPPRTWKRASQLEALVQVELHYERMLRDEGIQITIVRGPLPLYLWITDSSAVWVLCPLEPRMRFSMIWYDLLTQGRIDTANPLDEHGFFKCDMGFVERFRHVWRQYNAVELHPASMLAKASQDQVKRGT